MICGDSGVIGMKNELNGVQMVAGVMGKGVNTSYTPTVMTLRLQKNIQVKVIKWHCVPITDCRGVTFRMTQNTIKRNIS